MTNSGLLWTGQTGGGGGQQHKRNNMVEGQLEMIFMPASCLPRGAPKYRRAPLKAGEVQRGRGRA